MQVDFYFQLLRRFHPEMLSQTMRAAVRNFIKQTNLDTYERMAEIYDFVADCDPLDHSAVAAFARNQRERVDRHSGNLLGRGERILNWLDATYARKQAGLCGPAPVPAEPASAQHESTDVTPPSIPGLEFIRPGSGWELVDLFGVSRAPVPYEVFRNRLAEQNRNAEGEAVCVN
jgi:anaerobic magnesium-protoporphyrin IX monomethyl ester cyclase